MIKVLSPRLAIKALIELGPGQIGLYAWYRLALRSGYLRWKTKPALELTEQEPPETSQLNLDGLRIPSSEAVHSIIGPEGLEAVLAEADEVSSGKVRLFGGPPVALELTPLGALRHWTAYESEEQLNRGSDIKWTWEPGRFGWAHTLARAYHLSEKEKYPQTFWKNTEEFLDSNPANMGPHWVSGQEVALRLMAFAFATKIFVHSEHTTEERLNRIGSAIARHAERIPPTLAYGRAQNNNHLLTEAAGLLTASLMLPEHPKARHWRKLGWHWINRGLQSQITSEGAYVQHSTNYHRLMLQVALWVSLIREQKFPAKTRRRLATATEWLLALVDPSSGRAPNLGPNDSAYILPWTFCPIEDYRPVMQAASLAFLSAPAYPPGPWDEMSAWFGMDERQLKNNPVKEEDRYRFPPPPSKDDPIVLRGDDSWAYLRVTNFNSRPGHADQLHLDLWWRGQNIGQDAGTYLYNAEQPWDNSLAGTQAHNTITLEDQDQMTRAGRFLWLDWAQGRVLEHERGEDSRWERMVGQHDGYRRSGAIHQRSVESGDSRWIVSDTILPVPSSRAVLANQRSPFLIRLHWLLPDWPWDIKERGKDARAEMRIDSPDGWIGLRIRISSNQKDSRADERLEIQVCRAGKLLYGEGNASQIRGWVSRNYGYKTAALSLSVAINSELPVTFTSEWIFPS